MVRSSDFRRQGLQRLRDGIAAGTRVDEIEDHYLECKEDPSTRSGHGVVLQGSPRSEKTATTVADAVACFACADGGVVVLGIDDKLTGQEVFVGTPADTAWLANRVRQLVATEVVVDEHDVDGQRIVTVAVGPSYVPVQDTRHRYRCRRGRDCHEMTGAELGAFSVGRRTDDWSAPPSRHHVSDVSPEAMAQVRRWLRGSTESERVAVAGRNDEDVLSQLGIADARGLLNRAGELLVVDVPGREPLLDLSCRAGIGGDTEHRIDPPGQALATVLGSVETAIAVRNPTHPAPAGLTVGQLSSLPPRAYREAIVNAVMHRDWSRPEPVRIELEGAQLTVTSPGGFVYGVTEDTVITAPPKSRNDKLARAFRGLRLAEAEGSGIDRMIKETVRLGLPRPSIYELAEGAAVRCVIVGGAPDPAVLRVVAALGPSRVDDVDILLLLDALERRPSINAQALAPIIQKRHAQAVDALSRARASGLVAETGRSGYHRLTDEHRAALAARLHYLRRSAVDYEILIDRLIEEHGEVRARDVIDHTGISQVQASRVLSAATDAGIVERRPSADAVGRSVYYVNPNR